MRKSLESGVFCFNKERQITATWHSFSDWFAWGGTNLARKY